MSGNVRAGIKQTWAGALHMSAIGGRADIAQAHRKCDCLEVIASERDVLRYSPTHVEYVCGIFLCMSITAHRRSSNLFF